MSRDAWLPVRLSPGETKACCANVYGSEAAQLLLGESFHPGGLALTLELAGRLQLSRGTKLLDVACGRGASALAVAESFGCEVVGVDLSDASVAVASEGARARRLSDRVRFATGDAEALQLEEHSFDAILCECAFCTFPDKAAAAGELYRVLKPGGRLGLSDLTRTDDALPGELAGLLAWVSCIAGALPKGGYADWLGRAGFDVEATYDRSKCLLDLVQQIRARLGMIEIMAGLKKLNLPGLDLTEAKRLVRTALTAIERGELGYAVVIARKAATHRGRS